MQKTFFQLHKSSWFFFPANFYGFLFVFLTLVLLVTVQFLFIIYCNTQSLLYILIRSFPSQLLLISLFFLVTSFTLKDIPTSKFVFRSNSRYIFTLLLLGPLVYIYSKISLYLAVELVLALFFFLIYYNKIRSFSS